MRNYAHLFDLKKMHTELLKIMEEREQLRKRQGALRVKEHRLRKLIEAAQDSEAPIREE